MKDSVGIKEKIFFAQWLCRHKNKGWYLDYNDQLFICRDCGKRLMKISNFQD